MMQVELHRHLDIALRPSTLFEFAQADGIVSSSTTLEQFKSDFILRTQMSDLSAVLDKFELYARVLKTPARIERMAFEGVEDCYHEGTNGAELRFSPSFMCQFSGLSWDLVLDATETGMRLALEAYPDIRAGLICIGSREQGLDQVTRTSEFFLKHQSRFIGFDLAGHETVPNRNFESAFKPLIAAGANITVHAGESTDATAVWESIELLGAKRIGHGIRAIDDTTLVKYLAEKKILLEVCPTSNWLTRAAPEWKDQPLKKFLDAGVPVSINTDDPSMFGLTLPHEFRVAREKLGISEAEINKCKEYAVQASFLDLRH
ncbi:MAG: adenosine deaminase [Xanthomonadaceae bacterium]|nr:adenosine deaminase [Xanthomonadaceae bacterium]